MKRLFGIILFFCLILVCARGCIHADTPEKEFLRVTTPDIKNFIFPADNKNVVINGIDYIQSQAPVGIYGGELVISTIGEGPKTFNPCNTKDATSASMAGILYDGLLTTDPRNGKVIPLLAKSYKIDGNDYIITLRKGVKWTDGVPITADDVMYTYQEIVFKGLGNPSAKFLLI